MKVDTAVVLCAGKGTRLYPVTLGTPKALVPVANKPMVLRIAEDLAEAGIQRVVVVVSPWDDRTVPYLRRRGPAGLEVDQVVQDEPLGLAHAVAQTRAAVGSRPFVLYLGDELIDPGCQEFIAAAADGDADGAVLLCQVDEPEHFGVALMDGDRIVRLVEKPRPPCPSNLAVVGVYILPPQIYDAIEDTPPSARGEVEITDAIQRLIDEGLDIRGPIHRGAWFDVGRFPTLLAANRYCLDREVSSGQMPVAGAEVYGNVLIEGDCDVSRCVLRGPVAVASGCVLRDCAIGPYVSIGPSSVVTGSRITDSILGERCRVSGLAGGLTGSVLADEVVLDGGGSQSTITITAGKRTCLALKNTPCESWTAANSSGRR